MNKIKILRRRKKKGEKRGEKMIDLRNGDCLEVLKNIEDNSVDLILTDPPYHLTSITKRFGKKGSAPASTKNNDGSFSVCGTDTYI